MDDSLRFDRARATAGYKSAFLDDVPAPRFRPVAAALGVVIIVALVWVMSIARPMIGAMMAGAGAVLLGVVTWSLIVETRAPIVRTLAIVASSWSGLRGSTLEVQGMARTVTLRDVYGIERDYRLAPRVVGDALAGTIGLATIRRDTVVQFAVLDA